MTVDYDSELQARYGTAVALGGAVDDHLELRRILTRRTHRRFTPEPVPEGLTALLLAAAFSASSKSDFQQASVIRLADPARRQRLATLFPDMPWIGSAPLFLVFCGDARRLERLGELRGHAQDNGALEGLFNATVDAALALQTCLLAAEAAGLGCCPISVLRNRIDEVGEILALPDKVFPVAGLCLGYPAQSGFVSMRLPLAATVHRDGYDDAGLATVVDDYDRRRDARFAIPRERRRAPERFGEVALYGWSEDKTRMATEPEGSGFAAWLRRRGFTFM